MTCAKRDPCGIFCSILVPCPTYAHTSRPSFSSSSPSMRSCAWYCCGTTDGCRSPQWASPSSPCLTSLHSTSHNRVIRASFPSHGHRLELITPRIDSRGEHVADAEPSNQNPLTIAPHAVDVLFCSTTTAHGSTRVSG